MSTWWNARGGWGTWFQVSTEWRTTETEPLMPMVPSPGDEQARGDLPHFASRGA